MKEEPIIRAVILAAGRGERMQPLSDLVPKPLLFCAGMTLIERLIHSFRVAGVRKFTVGVGWKGELVREHLMTLSDNNLIDVVDVPNYERGPLQTLVTALSTVNDREFLISPTDYFVVPEAISALLSEHSHGTGSRILTLMVGPNREKGTPVFAGTDGLVAGIGESTEAATSIGSSAMLVIAERSFKSWCTETLEDGAAKVVSAINRMITEGKSVRYAVTKQQWFDIDNLSALLKLNHHLLQNMMSYAKGWLFMPSGQEVIASQRGDLPSSVEFGAGAKVIGPVLISHSCHVGAGATVGPFVTMGRNSRVGPRTSVVESILFGDSEVLARARVENAAVYGQTVYRSESTHVAK